ncbi:transporter substrate-binding domain-containing protein [Treponema parvum]|uniref:Transporter substrate-binding domain-containing protein n=1 Tax=Treponema parvum TaxID=138851 RepID=A0A975EXN2_9SPIR|nr:transporter substrate-binding domain-containing protein [Treponema parvum]QTQ10763.1 transporter substrate-binding domain-containing protein [Treponema parvum]
MKKLKIIAAICLSVLSISCSKSSKTAGEIQNTSVRKIYVAHSQSYIPYAFVNEKNESDGFEVALWKEIDKRLSQYEVEFVPTSSEDLLIGVETGKYNVGIKGIWSTEQRRQKYLFPKNYLGASVIGLTFRKENANVIHDLESFAAFSGKLVPISPQSAQYAIITDFNDKHPDKPIKLIPADVFDIPESYSWVLEGRYDGFFDLQVAYKRNIEAENGSYHKYADKLSYVVYEAVPTWPLFSKNEKQLADDYDKTIAQIFADGTYALLSKSFFGEDVSKYVKK